MLDEGQVIARSLARSLAGRSSGVHEAEAGSRGPLGGQLGVAGRGEAPAQVLEDVERQAADQRDDGHLPQERHRGDEVDVWQGKARHGPTAARQTTSNWLLSREHSRS